MLCAYLTTLEPRSSWRDIGVPAEQTDDRFRCPAA
jgi:hypothetical protein